MINKNHLKEEEIVLSSEPLEEKENAEIEKTEEVSAKTEEKKEAFRVSEIQELREANKKVFRMSDGTEQAVFYPNAVHIFDEETNSFEDIDNTLIESRDQNTIVNGKGNFTVEFSEDETTNELFSVSEGAHRITFSLNNNSMCIPKPIKKSDKTSGKDKIVFEDIYSGTDFEYYVTETGIRENIVIKENANKYSFSFRIHCENVNGNMNNSNKLISFVSNDTGEEILNIWPSQMHDAYGDISDDVSYDFKKVNNDIILNITADDVWINEEGYVLPVTIDSHINFGDTSAIKTYEWSMGSIYDGSIRTKVGVGSNSFGNRFFSWYTYISIKIPKFLENFRIKKAELKFFQYSATIKSETSPKFGLYQVKSDIKVGSYTLIAESNLIDYCNMKKGEYDGKQNPTSYTFDITKFIDSGNKGEDTYMNFVLKKLNEDNIVDNIDLFGYSADYAPQLIITYESGYGVNHPCHSHTYSLGRFGQGSVDLYNGNFMLESEDFKWVGSRMPVTIKHIYNSALANYQYTSNTGINLNSADFSSMKLGNGFRLNIMQSMVERTFFDGQTNCSGYIYVDENGNENCFKKTTKNVLGNDNTNQSEVYEDLEESGIFYNASSRELHLDKCIKLFDTKGRLITITDEYNNSMNITYVDDRISSVTDGAGRVFNFSYTSAGYLHSITAPDGTTITYTYDVNLLNTVTYGDCKKAEIIYRSNLPYQIILLDECNAVYKSEYTFDGTRLSSMTEYGSDNGDFILGCSNAFSYSIADRKTVVSTTLTKTSEKDKNNIINTVYTFDNNGNVISKYMYSKNIENTDISSNGAGSDSGIVSNINNLLLNHNFNNLGFFGTGLNRILTSCENDEPYSGKFGMKSLRLEVDESGCVGCGVHQLTNPLPAGKYTFSVYARVDSDFTEGDDPGAFIRVGIPHGANLGESERLTKAGKDYIRLSVSFTLKSEQIIMAMILLNGKGTVFVNSPQLEKGLYANAYNMIENGNFEYDTNKKINGCYYRFADKWDASDENVLLSDDIKFNMNRSLHILGDLSSSRYASQTIKVMSNPDVRETFTLSGWAKGYGIIDRERENALPAQFRLRAEMKYYDTDKHMNGTENYIADFSSDTEEWQLASVQFTKKKGCIIEDITVYCEYNNNFGDAYFDSIQLIKNSFEPQRLKKYTIEDDFEEAKDEAGNTVTETIYKEGEFGTIYRSFDFDDSKNNIIRKTDERGNKTSYSVDDLSSRITEVTDRAGHKTAYEYDSAGKIVKVISKKDDGTSIAEASYTYDFFDNVTSISVADKSKSNKSENTTEVSAGDEPSSGTDSTTGGAKDKKYNIKYNAFQKLESVNVDGKDGNLIKYEYENENGKLKKVTYANGSYMEVEHNALGQKVAEKWYEKAENSENSYNLTYHYKYVYDACNNVVRIIDVLENTVFDYAYEDGKIIRETESTFVPKNDKITEKTVVNSIINYYDSYGRLIKKHIIPKDGEEQIIRQEYTESGDVIKKFSVGGKTITHHTKTDGFGRKIFDEMMTGSGLLSSRFEYEKGAFSEKHDKYEKHRSCPTTDIVEKIVSSDDNKMLAYEYYNEKHLKKVYNSFVEHRSNYYSYDELGRLVKETYGSSIINVTYDAFGNIVKKDNDNYIYDDQGYLVDIEKSNNTDTGIVAEHPYFVNDKQGNPTKYYGNILKWEKGGQLKSFGDVEFTYNYDGIRTSKTANGVKHTYILDGTKIVRETWQNNILIPIYDGDDSICGIIYNDEPFYFFKNHYGDIIAIVDSEGITVNTYVYNAFGHFRVEGKGTVGNYNPFLYRGFYFDKETKLYNINSRYYDPNVGRFINADNVSELVNKAGCRAESLNLYSFCENDFVNGIYVPKKLF